MAEPQNKLVKAFGKHYAGPGVSEQSIDAFLRFDAWVNSVTGFGTGRDKTTYGRFHRSGLLTDQQLSDLYHHSDMAARMVDVVPDELFREGFSVSTGSAQKDAEWLKKAEEISVRENLADALRWGRGFGAGAVLIGADDKRPADVPLIPERADDVRWLYTFDRRYIQPASYYSDPKSPKFGKPETYMVTSPSGRRGGGTKLVHESRLIVFGGANTAEQEREENGGWDYSLLQRAHEVIRQFDTAWTSVENLLTDAHQAVWTMSGLADAITAGQKDYVQSRAQQSDLARSVVRAIVVDAGDGGQSPAEKFERHSISFDGIPNTLDKIMLRLAASVKLPVTILMGQSPAGMNATGESDFRWFYDQIRAEQTQKIAPLARRLVDVWLRTKAGGGASLNTSISWPPLWTETPTERATRRKTVMETDQMAIQEGLLLPDEVALARGQPGGFDQEIVLSPKTIAAHKASLKIEQEALKSGQLSAKEEEAQTIPGASSGGGFGDPSVDRTEDGSGDEEDPPPVGE